MNKMMVMMMIRNTMTAMMMNNKKRPPPQNQQQQQRTQWSLLQLLSSISIILLTVTTTTTTSTSNNNMPFVVHAFNPIVVANDINNRVSPSHYFHPQKQKQGLYQPSSSSNLQQTCYDRRRSSILRSSLRSSSGSRRSRNLHTLHLLGGGGGGGGSEEDEIIGSGDESGGEFSGGIGVGIDLGTTNSAVAYLHPETNQPHIVEIPNNGRTIKSIVAVRRLLGDRDDDDDDDHDSRVKLFRSAMVGYDAIEWERYHDETAYRHVKRVIGQGSTFLSTETRQVVPHIAPPRTRKLHSLDDDEDGYVGTSTKRKTNKKPTKKKKKKKDKAPTLQRRIDDARENPVMLYPLHGDDNEIEGLDTTTESQTLPSLVSPETISSCIIQRLLDVAADRTQQQISRAVIGIPAYFNDEQREATTRAAKACGLTKVKLLPEPEAAALAYGVGKKRQQAGGGGDDNDDDDDDEELVLVFDLGGGTYDVSILLVGRGLTEIICTSGNAQLGGTNFDAKIATYLSKLVHGCCKSEDAKDAVIRSAEAIRIYLSNHRSVNLALPLTQDGWLSLADGHEVIESSEDSVGGDNTTHIFHKWTRREMERLCSDEFQSLLQPIREVAIMAGALLPGDARPSVVETALELDAAYSNSEERFYGSDEDSIEDSSIENQHNSNQGGAKDSQSDAEAIPQEVLDFAAAKKMQQKGRKKARRVAKDERKFKAEQRRVAAEAFTNTASGSPEKVQGDGITGRPISRVVLVGGATRMPAIGRILSAVVGVVPQKTVDPDEAVALGCAVHVGVLDGMEGSGVVLNSMQAAILRAVAEKDLREGGEMTNRLLGDDDFDDDDEFFADEEFTTIEYI